MRIEMGRDKLGTKALKIIPESFSESDWLEEFLGQGPTDTWDFLKSTKREARICIHKKDVERLSKRTDFITAVGVTVTHPEAAIQKKPPGYRGPCTAWDERID